MKLLRASDEELKRGWMFETELRTMFQLAEIDAVHNSTSNLKDVDFLLPGHNIGVDAKWSGKPIDSEAIRSTGGMTYRRDQVSWIDTHQMKWQLIQRDKYNLDEIYFIQRLEVDGDLIYRVFSLSTLQNIFEHGHSNRQRRTESKKTMVTVFPQDSISIQAFFKKLKGGN